MIRFNFSCFADFCKDFSNQRRVCFFIKKSASRRDCEKHGAKDFSLLLNLSPENSISVLRIDHMVAKKFFLPDW
jgi:hypothetical protein